MELINFVATDGIKLNGILFSKERKSETVILSIHGMSSNCMKEREQIIAKIADDNGIDHFSFNNRGSELIKYIEKDIDDKKEKTLGGTAYEDVLEGYEDITGAIIKLKELGYKNIYLQGHSLGCTKIVYTYNELLEENDDMLKNIKGIILLSLVDIPKMIKLYLGEKYVKYLEYAKEKESKNRLDEIMPKESFIHPISVRTFLRYVKYNEQIDFADFDNDNNLIKLNNITIPLFMRWGNKNEMITQKADQLVNRLNNVIVNPKKNINYIDGANHSYQGKEKEVAEQIIQFINEY